MKTKTQAAKDVTGDFNVYKDFMRRLLSVPHSEIKARLDAEKAAKQASKAASRASDGRAKPA